MTTPDKRKKLKLEQSDLISFLETLRKEREQAEDREDREGINRCIANANNRLVEINKQLGAKP